MRAERFSEILHHLIERQQGLRAVLRSAHMPSFAVSEAVRMLRTTAHEIDVLANDCDEAHAEASANARQGIDA